MVKVNSYTRFNNGKSVSVSSHNRKVKKVRGDYKVLKLRQLDPIIRKANIPYDALIKAKKPGKRISASGKKYYERRFNRSDVNDFI